jgi:hypothetical protein
MSAISKLRWIGPRGKHCSGVDKQLARLAWDKKLAAVPRHLRVKYEAEALPQEIPVKHLPTPQVKREPFYKKLFQKWLPNWKANAA